MLEVNREQPPSTGADLRARIAQPRHAQRQLRGHRPHRHHLQHRRRLGQPSEPAYQNLYVKSNLSGEFTVVNEALVRDLKALDLWDEVMVADLKYFDGALGPHRPGARRDQGPLRHRLRDRARPG